MGSPAPVSAPGPGWTPPAAPHNSTTQAVVFICLSVVIFLACAALLSGTVWFCWRRSRREYEAHLQRQELEDAQNHKLEASVKKQVRLPVVIINPDDDVEYGRKESRYFPAMPEIQAKSSDAASEAQPDLPNTPPPGTYYIEGAPGYFEVDVEMCQETPGRTAAVAPCPSETPPTPRGVLRAAVALLSPRPSRSSAAVTPRMESQRCSLEVVPTDEGDKHPASPQQDKLEHCES